MISSLSPALILIIGAFLIPILPKAARSPLMLVLPILALLQLWDLPFGSHGQIEVLGLKLMTLRLDKLSLIFSTIFLIGGFLGVIYALHSDDTIQQVSGLAYAGSAVGAVLAGDLLTLFLYWEGTAVFSVFLIWASRTERSFQAGMRYIIIQVTSGVLLLMGALLHYKTHGNLDFNLLGLDGSLSHWLIFLSFGIKCAFPLLHNWLQDAYPQATITGTVMLSVFTTKLAVYALARGFAGTELLVAIGATMAAFPIVYALIENDLRKVLAYSLNSQLGFMVVGVGIGTELALNGTAAHAFCSVLYKALLFMSVGAVLLRTGTSKATELGGLFKSMPWTAGFCIVGAGSIAAFPLFSGFVSKSLIITAAMKEGYFWTWLILLFASAAAVHHTSIKVPFFAFFAKDSGARRKETHENLEAPGNMLVAMGITAALCIGIGVFPQFLYAMLPYKVDYLPYTLDHVVTQMQLLMFAILAFTLLLRIGIYPAQSKSSINLDTDWFYRRFGAYSLAIFTNVARWAWSGVEYAWRWSIITVERWVHRHYGPDGAMGRSWATGQMAFWATVMIGAYALIGYYYVQ